MPSIEKETPHRSVVRNRYGWESANEPDDFSVLRERYPGFGSLWIGSLRLCRGLVIQELRNGFRILEHC
jgi:hypothetical protein